MSFEAIDAILLPWLGQHGLQLMTESKDEEVRTTLIVDDSGDTYEVWVEKPDLQNKVRVTAGLIDTVHGRVSTQVRKGFRIERVATLPALVITMDEVYDQIVEWIGQRSHTRSPA